MDEFAASLFGHPQYAFAGAGDSQSLLRMLAKEADDIPLTYVQKNFRAVMGEASGGNTPSNLRLQDGDVFSAKLRDEMHSIDDLVVKDFDYIKRNPKEVTQLRKQFDSTERKKFLKSLSKDESYLK